MSEFSMFPMDTVASFHTIDVLVVQWDGTKESATAILASLATGLGVFDVEITQAHYRKVTFASPELELSFKHKGGTEWHVWVTPGDWIAAHRRHSSVSHIGVYAEADGQAIFRPVNPIVVLHDHRTLTKET